MRNIISTFRLLPFILLLPVSLLPQKTAAAVIRFNTLLSGQTSSGFDGDGDGINDVVFSTTDPSGFDMIGPGLNQAYIQEPGLAGNSFVNPALRVDFLYGAIGLIQFGFALDSSVANSSYVAGLQLYNANNVLLGSMNVPGAFTVTSQGKSSFPEGIVVLNFSDVASYGLFTFVSPFHGYIIDNFQGVFGNTEVPEPGTMTLLGLGLAGLLSQSRTFLGRRKTAA